MYVKVLGARTAAASSVVPTDNFKGSDVEIETMSSTNHIHGVRIEKSEMALKVEGTPLIATESLMCKDNGDENKTDLVFDSLDPRSVQEMRYKLKGLDDARCEWRRSKLMIVGQGRAGKTAFSRAVVGAEFEETPSTVGIEEFSCIVNDMSTVGDSKIWKHCPHGREKEYETGIVRSLSQKLKGDACNVETLMRTFSENSTPYDSVDKVASLPIEDDMTSPSTLNKVESFENSVESTATPMISDEMDTDFVMQCFTDESKVFSSMMIGIFDFGGQEIFTAIHHLFLTSYGVYALCFNMEWLLSSETRDGCLRYLQFWIGSISVHTTQDRDDNYILIGTHKDKVRDPGQHEEIHRILEARFENSPAWCYKIDYEEGQGSNGRTTLCFFPVDCTQGRNDCVLQAAMRKIEEVMVDADYTKTLVPLEWLRCIDKAKETKKSFFPTQEFRELAHGVGVKDEDVDLLLIFLHEMGMCIHINQHLLKDIVIMDAIQYFVHPASMVIRNHSAGKDEKHGLQKQILKNFRSQGIFEDYVDFKEKGVLSDTLLKSIWKDYSSEINRLKSLMVHYGLIVPLGSFEETILDNSGYLVPSLLPLCSEGDILNIDGNWGQVGREVHCCYLIMTFGAKFAKETIMKEDLHHECFWPTGIYERLLGKIFSWAQMSSNQPTHLHPFKDVSVLSFGGRYFRLVALPDLSSIRVDIQGNNANVIASKLRELVEQTIQECVRGLKVVIALPFLHENQKSLEAVSIFEGLSSDRDSSKYSMLIPWSLLSTGATSHGVSNRHRQLMSQDEIRNRYCSWLNSFDTGSFYDLFISYYPGHNDKLLARLMFDWCSNFALQDREIAVFLDVLRIQPGQKTEDCCVNALIKSTILILVVSMESLEVLKNHDPSRVDEILLQWILSTECMNKSFSRVQCVIPVFVGNRGKYSFTDTVDGHLDCCEDIKFEKWDKSMINTIDPDIKPVATIERCAHNVILCILYNFLHAISLSVYLSHSTEM